MEMYATINIGNLHMTCESLKGNPCIDLYAGCNGDSHVRMRVAMEIVVYATQHLEKLYGKLVER